MEQIPHTFIRRSLESIRDEGGKSRSSTAVHHSSQSDGVKTPRREDITTKKEKEHGNN